MMVSALLALAAISVLALVAGPATQQTQLFENPETPSDDADSWTIQGILDDGIDGDTAEDPFKLDDVNQGREARTKARLGLKQVGGQHTTMLLGGDDWLGAPLAVPEDVRDRGEQQIGEEVTYWNTHSGQVGTGGGGATYPYARAQSGQILLVPRAQTQILKRMSADEANAQMDDIFDEVATNEEVHQYAERGVDISGAAASHRSSYGAQNW